MKNRRMLFSSLIGHELLKRAYIANIVNPSIGGLLIMGPKGSGKSTMVHSLENILPQYKTMKGCAFNCMPEEECTYCGNKQGKETINKRMSVITLPLSCTEDRLIGSIDIEELMKSGKKRITAGILGQAHRNILYVDEVNLLPDHLVDDILDTAASHINIIEREGISIMHDARFVLVGSMNPEEGELRPQILDRFPLAVNVSTISDPAERAVIVKRNMLFEDNYNEYSEQFTKKQEQIGKAILDARSCLGNVSVSDELIMVVSEACAELKVDGQRPDIVIIKTSKTFAAMRNDTEVRNGDIKIASMLALIHRTRDGGLLAPPSADEINNILDKFLPKGNDKEYKNFLFETYNDSSSDGEHSKKA